MNQKLRQQILERDNFTCQFQQCKRKSLDLEIHHVIPRRSCGSDTLDNLITYCKYCHKKIEPPKLAARIPITNPNYKSVYQLRITDEQHAFLTSIGRKGEDYHDILQRVIDDWKRIKKK